MTTIHVDFNWRRGWRKTLLRAFQDDATGPLALGDTVRALDPGDGTERRAVVEYMDDDTVWLRVLPS